MYVGSLDADQLEQLRAAGIDSGESGLRPATGGTVAVETVLAAGQARRLVAAGVPLTAKRTTKAMRARATAAPTVFRPYNAPGGIREELEKTAAGHPGLVKLVTIGGSGARTCGT